MKDKLKIVWHGIRFPFVKATVVCCLLVTALGIVLADDASIRISEIEVSHDYMFASAEIGGSISNRENIIDTLVSTNLAEQSWVWVDANRVGAGTNSVSFLFVPQLLGMTNMPPQLFLTMLDRESENSDLLDRDLDGAPNVYEFFNGTNPYVADYTNSPRIVVATNCDYDTFTDALWDSTPYSIIEISGEMYLDRSIDLPDWPLLITGPTNGYAVIHSKADIGIFMINRWQTDHTFIRNVYLMMDKDSSFQAGFWIGANLPWVDNAAGASFENVRIRMYNPNVWYYGWHMYGITDTPVRINNCTISAAGATVVFPVYVYGDSQVVITNGLDLINMPDVDDSAEYTWTGYSLTEEYSPLKDSDGDGLSDYEEIYQYGTDIWLRDSDGDRIEDATEILHGANPTNQSAYCYELTVGLTNLNAGVVSFSIALYDAETSNRVSQVYRVTNHVNEVKLHHTLLSGELPHLYVWSADENKFIQIPYSVKGHDIAVSVTENRLRTVYDSDNDGLPDEWELRYGLSPSNSGDALNDDDGDGLINIYEYLSGHNPTVIDGTNTALSVCTRSVDFRLEGRSPQESLSKFVNYIDNQTNFVLNTSFWAADVDTTCASMWNSAATSNGWANQWNRAGTAISRRHIITANHYKIPIGTTVWFMGCDGVPCSRVVTGESEAIVDICIQSLDADLPETVTPAKILPENYHDYLFDLKRVPVVTLDQEEKLLVADSGPLKDYEHRGDTSVALCPLDAIRQSFYEAMIEGDSGSPRFLVFDSQVVLLYVMRQGGTGSGYFVTHYKTEIQDAMNLLCPGYTLEEVDLSCYEQINR